MARRDEVSWERVRAQYRELGRRLAFAAGATSPREASMRVGVAIGVAVQLCKLLDAVEGQMPRGQRERVERGWTAP